MKDIFTASLATKTCPERTPPFAGSSGRTVWERNEKSLITNKWEVKDSFLYLLSSSTIYCMSVGCYSLTILYYLL